MKTENKLADMVKEYKPKGVNLKTMADIIEADPEKMRQDAARYCSTAKAI